MYRDAFLFVVLNGHGVSHGHTARGARFSVPLIMRMMSDAHTARGRLSVYCVDGTTSPAGAGTNGDRPSVGCSR